MRKPRLPVFCKADIDVEKCFKDKRCPTRCAVKHWLYSGLLATCFFGLLLGAIFYRHTRVVEKVGGLHASDQITRRSKWTPLCPYPARWYGVCAQSCILSQHLEGCANVSLGECGHEELSLNVLCPKGINGSISKELFHELQTHHKISQLFIASTDLSEIQCGTFDTSILAKLRVLVLDLPQLQTLSNNTFQGLINLAELTLCNVVNMYQVDSGVLTPVQNSLETLSISGLRTNNSSHMLKNFTGAVNLLAMQTLDVRGNNLNHLPSGTFRGAVSVRSIYLSHSHIQSIEPGAFSSCTNLEQLFLNWNYLKSLEEGVISGIPFLKTLWLSNNPWYCNCSLQWVQSWLAKGLAMPSSPKCYYPREISGKYFDNVTFCHNTLSPAAVGEVLPSNIYPQITRVPTPKVNTTLKPLTTQFIRSTGYSRYVSAKVTNGNSSRVSFSQYPSHTQLYNKSTTLVPENLDTLTARVNRTTLLSVTEITNPSSVDSSSKSHATGSPKLTSNGAGSITEAEITSNFTKYGTSASLETSGSAYTSSPEIINTSENYPSNDSRPNISQTSNVSSPKPSATTVLNYTEFTIDFPKTNPITSVGTVTSSVITTKRDAESATKSSVRISTEDNTGTSLLSSTKHRITSHSNESAPQEISTSTAAGDIQWGKSSMYGLPSSTAVRPEISTSPNNGKTVTVRDLSSLVTSDSSISKSTWKYSDTFSSQTTARYSTGHHVTGDATTTDISTSGASRRYSTSVSDGILTETKTEQIPVATTCKIYSGERDQGNNRTSTINGTGLTTMRIGNKFVDFPSRARNFYVISEAVEEEAIKLTLRVPESSTLVWLRTRSGFGCLTELPGEVTLEDLVPGRPYTFCVLLEHDARLSPFNCLAHSTSPRYKDQAWLTNREKAVAVCGFAACLVLAVLLGAAALFAYVKRHPTLIKGKRVLVAKHRVADVIVLPSDYKGELLSAEVLQQRVAAGDGTDRSERSRASTTSYVTVNEPTALELFAYRFEQMVGRLGTSFRSSGRPRLGDV